ncbi:MAG: outer membrane lipoprotein-sorting protein [Burkholderiales bacterium]
MRSYIEFIVRFRWVVIALVAVATMFLSMRGGNLTVIIDPNNIVPRSHPFIATTLKVEEVFGSRYVAVIGVTAKQGDVFQPAILEKVQRMTTKLRETPRIVKTNILSLSARRAKDIRGNTEGMEVKQIMADVPLTPEGLAAIKNALERNTSYMNAIVSNDWKTTVILAEVRDRKKTDGPEVRGGFTFVADKILAIANAERDDSVDIMVSGYPPFLSMFERFAGRTPLLLMAALIIIGIIHWEAFRTVQGLLLPLLTPLVAVEWSKGFMGLADVPLDIFNMSTPILILAVGAGHAVQLLKRYYEEYHRLNPVPDTGIESAWKKTGGMERIAIFASFAALYSYLYFNIVGWKDVMIAGGKGNLTIGGWGPELLTFLSRTISPAFGSHPAVKVGAFLILGLVLLWAYNGLWRLIRYWRRPAAHTTAASIDANRQAVIESIVKIGPVMITAGIVAVSGFLSLMVFDIVSIRVFGIFSGVGILCVLIVEMTLIPALRSVLPPPGKKEASMEKEERVWDRLTTFYARTITGPNRGRLFVVASVVAVISVIGMSRLGVESSLKKYFDPDLPLLKDDRTLNSRMAGTNNVYVLIEGDKPDAIKDPAVLKAMDKLQAFISEQPHIGKVMSLAEFIKRMNQSMNGDDPAYFKIPDSQATIAEFLLLYSMSGEPGDFDTYVDYDYRLANMVVFSHSDSTVHMLEMWNKAKEFAAKEFPPNIKVNIGGSVAQSAAITEVIVRDKVLNVVQIAGVVFLIASLVFRSFVAGALVITPLLLSVLVNMGLLGLMGLKLNVPVALTSALAIGIGADYAIYMLFRLREELGKGTEFNEAFHNVLGTAGKACLFVASAVAGGYAVQALSRGYYPHTWNAILIGTAMVVSVTAALTVMPALVHKFRPKFIFNGAVNMKPSYAPAAIAAAGLAFIVALGSWSQPAHALSPMEIMEKNFISIKYQDSISQTTMTLTNKEGKQRVRKTFGTSKLQANGIDNMRMTRFLEPTDVKGTVSLLIEQSEKDDDIWIYLPSTKKVRRLISSNKKDSFVGTDFSYGDIIGHKPKEWTHTLVKEEAVDGADCYVIESTPINASVKSNSGYSKRILWIQKDTFVSLKVDFYDESGDLLKQARFSNIKLADAVKKRYQPLLLEAHNVQTEHKTQIRIDESKSNTGVKSDYFTTRYMEQQ